MKAIASQKLLPIAAALAAGFALGRFAVRPVPPAPGNAPTGPAAVASDNNKTVRETSAPFTGTIEDLLKIARGIHQYHALAERLRAALEPLPASALVALSAAFSWDEKLTWQEAATCQVILECWLAKDDSAAQSWAGLLPQRCREGSLTAFLAATARSDPGKAVAWAQRIDDHGVRALTEIAGEMAVTDPQAALRLLQANADSGDDYRYDDLFDKWAERDPAAACAAAMSLPVSEARTKALRWIFLQWTLLDRPAAYAAALAQPKGERQNAALLEVLNTWASREPKAALAAAQSLPKEQQRAAVRAVLRGWIGSDPAAATVAVAALPLSERKGFNKELADAWMKRDPLAVLTWVKALSENEGGDEIVGDLMAGMARADGPAAAAAWSSLPPGKRAAGLHNIITEWAARDFDGAMQWAKSLEHPQDRGNAVSGCMMGLDFSQSDKINALLAELPPGESRQSAISILVAQQCDKDIGATLRFLSTISAEERAETMAGYGILEALAGGDPRQTLALLEETPGLAPTSSAWQGVVEKLAVEDPAEALQWAAGLSRADAKQNALDKVLTTWAQTDGSEAMRQARLLSDPALQKELTDRVLYVWAAQDPDAVLQWAETAPAAERDKAVLQGALGKAENDPAAGAAIINALLKENSTDSWIPGMVAAKWFSVDMNAACEWTLRLPPGGVQEDALSRIVGSWAQSDAMAASKWVKELPPGNGRDAAAMSLIRGISGSDPESALTWAAGINDAPTRNDAISAIAEHLDEIGAAASRAAVEQSPLSDGEKQSLLEKMPEE